MSQLYELVRTSALRKVYEGDANKGGLTVGDEALKENVGLYNHIMGDSGVKLVSSTPKAFVAINEQDFNEDFCLSEEELDYYIDGFFDGIQSNAPKILKDLVSDGIIQEDLIESALDDSDVKLSLYRSFKSLNDKWISNSGGGDNVASGYFFNNYGKKGVDELDNRTLFEHFSFVNRTGYDVGGKSVIDVSYLSNLSNTKNGQGPTQTLYQSITNLLSKNNFDFFALPSFISYSDRDEKELTDMFRAFDGPLNTIPSSPTFVCVFVGGSSRALDIPRSSCGTNGTEFDYTDDSFDINEPTTYPEDFKENGGITAFKVRFGQEAQNHFSSIELDQAEFRETQESLMVIDALTNPETGSSPNQIGKGNNIFDVYLTRSYSCEVTALGNVNIQPLMFFKLENVPMFRGTYLIIDVKHEVKPHNVVTKFKGVRQPIVTVPLVTDALSILDLTLSNTSLDGETTSLSDSPYSVNGKYPPIKVGKTTNKMSDLIRKNGGVNGAPDSKETKSNNPIELVVFMDDGGLTLPSGGRVKWGSCSGPCRKFIKEGVEPFKQMLSDLDVYTQGLGGYDKHTMTIDGMFRPAAKQQQLWDASEAGGCKDSKGNKLSKCGNLAAEPLTSNHGWGIAIDWQWTGKDNEKLNASSNCSKPNNRWLSEQYAWLFQNSPNYGFVNTATLRDGRGSGDEVWHWIYIGTSVFDYMTQNPTSRGCRKVDLTWDSSKFSLKSFVTNPVDLETNKPAVFNPKAQKNIDEKVNEKSEDTQPFDPQPRAQKLYYAMKGIGTYEDDIWNALDPLTKEQAKEVETYFNDNYGGGETLIQWFEGDLDGPDLTKAKGYF